MELMRRQKTNDISYSFAAQTKSGRALIRAIENSTGRLQLIKRAQGYETEVAAGRGFFDVMLQRYGLSLDVVAGSLGAIPREGPLVLIANHPYGILDGLVMGHILSQVRGDFRLLAHSVFCKSQDLRETILPIRFDASKEALAQNLATRKLALNYLKFSGAIGIFPGGTVSTGLKPFSHPMDPGWRGFTARMIAKSQATVVPLYFEGHTSRFFQIASHLHTTLRMGLLVNEFRKRVDTPVRIAIGTPLDRAVLDPLAKDSNAMMDFLRKATYDLSTGPQKRFDLGYEFEERHRS